MRFLRVWMTYLFFCIAAAPLFNALSVPHVTLLEKSLGYLIFILCTLPVVIHLAGDNTSLPVFPIICLVYASGYSLPAFFTVPEVVSMSAHGGIAHIQEKDFTYALELSALGILSMELGFWLFKYSMLHLLTPKLRLHLDAERAKRWMIIAGVAGLFILWLSSTGRLGIPRNFFYVFILVTKLSSLSMALLYYYYLRGMLNPRERYTLLGMGLFISVLALGSGNLRAVFDPMIILGAVYWLVRGKFPWKFMGLGIVIFFILQPIKSAYREQVWSGGFAHFSMTQRMQIWELLAEKQWLGLFEGKSSAASTSEVARGSLNRTDLIHMFGRVVSLTPRRVPYQLSKTYDYFFYALVPRFLWPDKPGAQSANEFFGVSYDFQTPESIRYTSIGMPHLIEAYINFGATGVVCMMVLIGMLYGSVEQSFNHEDAGEGGLALYATLMTSLWTIETATAPTFGALFQTTFLYAAVMWHFRVRKKHTRLRVI